MNRQIRIVGLGICALFVALFVQLNYLTVVHAKALDNNPLNGARIVQEFNKPRGDIVSADGVTLANSVATPPGSQFKYQRRYPTGSLFGQITGYYSFIYGADGAEKTYNDILTGTTSKAGFPTSLSGLQQLLTTRSPTQNLTLTLSDKLQSVARSELAGKLGSVVAIQPTTGAILAMYSNPSYNPTALASLSTTAEQQAYKQLLAAPNNPLLPGAYRNRWFPGSSFKILTAAAVYDHKPALADKVYPNLAALPLPQTTTELHNFAGEVCGGKLLELFKVSCDTGFGAVGLDLGPAALHAEATSFGFDATPPLDLPSPVQSYFPPVSSFDRNLPTLAYSAIGQEDVQASPLEMAMVGAAIADRGTIMAPHVLADVTNSQDQVISRYQDHAWLQATSASTAAQVTTMMEAVVNSPGGTAPAAAIPGITVAGKTGTAQTTLPNGQPGTDDWFVAFAPAAHPTIAVAVVLPDQGSANEYQGGTLAAPIARAMIQSFLAGHPALQDGRPTSTGAAPPKSTSTTAPPATSAPATTAPPATAAPTTAPPATAPPATAPPATSAPATTSAPTTASTGTTTKGGGG